MGNFGAVGQVIGITNKNIRAASSTDGVPTFWVSGIVGLDFSGAMLSQAVESFGECRILLDSVGGMASDAFAFYDYVRVNSKKIHVEGYGTVASAATIIMAAAGRQRSYLSPNAEYLIHEASGADQEAISRYNDRMAKVYAELSGMDEKEIRAIMKADKPMSAQEAKKRKLVGAVLQHERIAAQYNVMEDTPIEVPTPEVETTEVKEEETIEVEQQIPVSPAQAVEAAFKGFITAKVKVAKEMSDAVGAQAEELKGVRAELQEATDEVTALKEKLATSEDARTKAEAEVETVKATAQAITAELDKLKADPIVAAGKGTEAREVQVPGGGPSKTMAKMTKEERRVARREAVKDAAIALLTKTK